MRKIRLASLLIGILFAVECANSQPIETSTHQAKAAAREDQVQLDQHIVAALQSRHYADALQLARQSQSSKVEVDFAVGEIILQGLADPDASQHPAESRDKAIGLIEKSALAGHRQAIAALAATYYTGLRIGATDRVLIAPDAAMKACWEAAKAKPKHATVCVAMRLKH